MKSLRMRNALLAFTVVLIVSPVAAFAEAQQGDANATSVPPYSAKQNSMESVGLKPYQENALDDDDVSAPIKTFSGTGVGVDYTLPSNPNEDLTLGVHNLATEDGADVDARKERIGSKINPTEVEVGVGIHFP